MVSPKHLKFVLLVERRQESCIRGRVVRSELVKKGTLVAGWSLGGVGERRDRGGLFAKVV